MDTVSYLTINDETKEIADIASRNNIENIAATIAAHSDDIEYIQLETGPNGSLAQLANNAYSTAYMSQVAASSAIEAAITADEKATSAGQAAQTAWNHAESANQAANMAWNKAVDATNSANEASIQAQRASYSADVAQVNANSAGQAAQEAWDKADDAGRAAQNAWDKADDAEQAAQNAQTNAIQANSYANGALAGLSTLESVIDTVNWFAEHKSLSTDTEVDSDKNYYIYNSSTGSMSKVEPNGSENPSEEGWYEIDETVQNYIASHVAQTNDGLCVASTSTRWRILISDGSGEYPPGIYLIDEFGIIKQASTENGISFDKNGVFYLGDPEDERSPYLVFDGINKALILGGTGVNINSGVTIGESNKTLAQVLNDLGQAITSIQYGVGNSPDTYDDIQSWSNATPEWQPDKYIWMRTTTNGLTYTYTCIQGSQGPQGEAGPMGETGPQGEGGIGIYSVEVSYAVTDSGDITPEDDEWRSSIDQWYEPGISEYEDEYGETGETGEYENEYGETGEYEEYGDNDEINEDVLALLEPGKWLWIRTETTYTDFTSSVTYQKSYIGTDGEKGETGEQGPPGQDSIRVEIDPIGGNFIKRGQVGTSLIAHVYEGINDITNQFNYFTWYRRKADGTRDTSWSTQETSNQLSITTADVDETAVFVCEVTVTR